MYVSMFISHTGPSFISHSVRNTFGSKKDRFKFRSLDIIPSHDKNLTIHDGSHAP